MVRSPTTFCRLIRTLVWTVSIMTPAFQHLLAQEGDEPENMDEEIYELPPFTVDSSADEGYRATNSISGSVISIPTRDLPFSLQVITSDFVEDLHATDLTEALQYSAGIFTESYESNSGASESFQDFSPSSNARSSSDPFADRITIRGYPVPNQQRNGFRIGAIVPAYGVILGGSTDTAAVERFEVVKGPSSILYGVNVLSGVVNLIPKRPLSEPRYEASVTTGNYDFYRATFDATGPVVDNVMNYRVITSYQENGDWTDYHEVRRRFGSFQIDWKLSSNLDLYIDVSKAIREESGFGPQLFQDGGARDQFSTAESLQGSNNQEYVRNEYGEFFTWGLDFDEEDADMFLDRQPDHAYEFPNLGYEYRISGPDTYREQDETNFTALLTATPTDHLRIELGAYVSQMEESNRLIDMASVTGGEGAAFVDNDKPGFPNYPGFSKNPEYDGGRIIENFPVPSSQVSGGFKDDQKFARYYWYSSPVESNSMQLRGRALYSFEQDLMGIDFRHNIIGGWSLIEDNVRFISDDSGSETLLQQTNHIYTETRQSEDPYHLRSIFDYTPIRYNGDALAITGDLLPIREVAGAAGNGGQLRYIRYSGLKDVDIWYRGMYGIYQGDIANGRATLIAGVRRDSYQVKEREQLRILDRSYSDGSDPQNSAEKPFTDIYHGSGNLVLPYLIGDGTGPYTPVPGLPSELNALVEEEYRLYQESYPDGTVEYNFAEAPTYITKSAGVSIRVTDSVSVYGSYSEGIFPNTGLRDGNYRPIAAEETESVEVGAKFDWEFWGGRISGDIAFYQMKRHHAVTYWDYAPNPGRWFGGDDPIDRSTNESRFFDPAAARGDIENSSYLEVPAPVSYGVAIRYVTEAIEKYGLPSTGRGLGYAHAAGAGFENALARGSINVNNDKEEYFYFNYTDVIENEAVKYAFDQAISDQDYEKASLFPIDWSGGPDPQYKNNPSNPASLGAFVTYEEEETGVDVSLLYEPIRNFQIVFGFSHFQREITGNGFNLLTTDRAEDGDIVATEYDKWVYILGADAFDDPRDPTSTNGKGVNGVDLAFVPHTSATLWSKYSFTEGWNKGLEAGFGVIYSGESPTSTTIGGSNLQINQYRTPDLPSRYRFDGLIGYEFEWQSIDWHVSLRVNNIFDQRSSERIVNYTTPEDEVVQRRSFALFTPRTFRLNVSASF